MCVACVVVVVVVASVLLLLLLRLCVVAAIAFAYVAAAAELVVSLADRTSGPSELHANRFLHCVASGFCAFWFMHVCLGKRCCV